MKAVLRGEKPLFSSADVESVMAVVNLQTREARKLQTSSTRYWALEYLRRQPRGTCYHALILRFLKEREPLVLVIEVRKIVLHFVCLSIDMCVPLINVKMVCQAELEWQNLLGAKVHQKVLRLRLQELLYFCVRLLAKKRENSAGNILNSGNDSVVGNSSKCGDYDASRVGVRDHSNGGFCATPQRCSHYARGSPSICTICIMNFSSSPFSHVPFGSYKNHVHKVMYSLAVDHHPPARFATT